MQLKNIFTDESYRLWRNDWRREYKTVSSIIREMKNSIRSLQKQGIRTGQLQCDLTWRQKEAREMMEQLEEAKEYRRRIFQAAA